MATELYTILIHDNPLYAKEVTTTRVIWTDVMKEAANWCADCYPDAFINLPAMYRSQCRVGIPSVKNGGCRICGKGA